MKNSRELILRDDFRELARAAAEVGMFLESQPIPANLASGACLALEEILNNVIKYGYGNSRCHEFRVEVAVEGREVMIRCMDQGHKFNPRLSFLPEPTDKNTDHGPATGGKGEYPALNVAYSLEYIHDGGQNILTMRVTPCKS